MNVITRLLSLFRRRSVPDKFEPHWYPPESKPKPRDVTQHLQLVGEFPGNLPIGASLYQDQATDNEGGEHVAHVTEIGVWPEDEDTTSFPSPDLRETETDSATGGMREWLQRDDAITEHAIVDDDPDTRPSDRGDDGSDNGAI